MELNHTNYLELQNKKLTRAEIATIFDIPDWKLKKHIAKNNWGRKLPSIGNPLAFSTLTEESCYWAGFIAADGNVDSKNRMRIMLKYDDFNHLCKIKEFLISTHTISVNTDKYYRCSFELTSLPLVSGLRENFNVVPNKSLILEFPESILQSEHLKHFIRGYFDGDGSICESFSNRKSVTASLYATFCSGSSNFIHDLQSIIDIEVGASSSLQQINNANKYQLKYNTNQAKLLLSWMYENSSVYLERKFQLYQKLAVNNDRTKR